MGRSVRRVEKKLLDGLEPIAIVHGQVVLSARGDIPLMRMLEQALDGVNVIALDLTVAERNFSHVRKLDKLLEGRILRTVIAAGLVSDETQGRGVMITLNAVIG